MLLAGWLVGPSVLLVCLCHQHSTISNECAAAAAHEAVGYDDDDDGLNDWVLSPLQWKNQCIRVFVVYRIWLWACLPLAALNCNDDDDDQLALLKVYLRGTVCRQSANPLPFSNKQLWKKEIYPAIDQSTRYCIERTLIRQTKFLAFMQCAKQPTSHETTAFRKFVTTTRETALLRNTTQLHRHAHLCQWGC